MNNQRLKVVYRSSLRSFLKYFLQGLIVLAPIGITVWAIIALFNLVDGILPNIFHFVFPKGDIEKIPGLGFLIVVTLVFLVGWISSSFVVKRLVDVLDKVLENTPGIKFIYSSVKDFLEALVLLG